MGEIEKQISLIDKMYKIAEKFADIALANGPVKQAKDALFTSDKALRMAIDLERLHRVDNPKEIEYNLYLIFLTTITVPMLRSEVWRGYIEFCDKYAVAMLQKSVFYAVLTNYNFLMYRDNKGSWMVKPPSNPSQSLLDAKNAWHLLDCDEQNLIEL